MTPPTKKESDDAALVAELRRLASEQGEPGPCDCAGAGDCDACWARRGTRLLDLAEEAIRLRAVRDAAEVAEGRWRSGVREHGCTTNVSTQYSMNQLRAALDAAKEQP